VTLARVDWQLGHRDRARKVIAKVIAGGAAPEVKREASDLESEWSCAAP
jgi:hypothetical protein